MPSKKQGVSASADSANDAVPVDETVRMPQDFINGTEFKGIYVGTGYKFVLALARHLIKPSELGGAFFNSPGQTEVSVLIRIRQDLKELSSIN